MIGLIPKFRCPNSKASMKYTYYISGVIQASCQVWDFLWVLDPKLPDSKKIHMIWINESKKKKKKERKKERKKEEKEAKENKINIYKLTFNTI